MILNHMCFDEKIFLIRINAQCSDLPTRHCKIVICGVTLSLLLLFFIFFLFFFWLLFFVVFGLFGGFFMLLVLLFFVLFCFCVCALIKFKKIDFIFALTLSNHKTLCTLISAIGN